MMWGYVGGPWGWIGPISMLLFWAGALTVMVYALRSWWAAAGRPPDGMDPLTVAQRQYAKGALTREAFLQVQADLTDRPTDRSL